MSEEYRVNMEHLVLRVTLALLLQVKIEQFPSNKNLDWNCICHHFSWWLLCRNLCTYMLAAKGSFATTKTH